MRTLRQHADADDLDVLEDPAWNAEQQDELENADVLPLAHVQQSPISGARCVNGNLVRPDNAELRGSSIYSTPTECCQCARRSSIGERTSSFW